MKKFTKFFAVLALVGASSLHAFAQDMTTTSMSDMKSTDGMAFKIGLGASGGLTTKSSPYDYVLGADLLLQWDLMRNVALTGSVGYTRFMTGDTGTGVEFGYLPAIGGVKVYPGIGRMYLSGNVGAGFAIEDGAKTSFVYGGGLGYDWENGLSLGARYEGVQQDSSSSTYVPYKQAGQFALRIGYNFKL